MHNVIGGCHCGNIQVSLQLSRTPDRYQPRACDCDFCRKHGAAYVSDSKGSLIIQIREPQERSRYTQGSGQAEFLLCRTCGVLVGAFHRHGAHTYATVNVRALQATTFAAEQTASPQQLSPDQKVNRWQDIWFSRVEFREGPGSS